jgi:hypothetical protein
MIEKPGSIEKLFYWNIAELNYCRRASIKFRKPCQTHLDGYGHTVSERRELPPLVNRMDSR